MKCVFVMRELLILFPCHDTPHNAIKDVLGRAVPMLQRVFGCDHFGPTRKQRNRFLLVSCKIGTESSKWVAKVLLPFSLGCAKEVKEVEYHFCGTWNAY